MDHTQMQHMLKVVEALGVALPRAWKVNFSMIQLSEFLNRLGHARIWIP